MTHRFTIRILPDRAPDFFTSGVTYEVQAMDLERPWLRVRLRVRQYRDDETAELRLDLQVGIFARDRAAPGAIDESRFRPALIDNLRTDAIELPQRGLEIKRVDVIFR